MPVLTANHIHGLFGGSMQIVHSTNVIVALAMFSFLLILFVSILAYVLFCSLLLLAV